MGRQEEDGVGDNSCEKSREKKRVRKGKGAGEKTGLSASGPSTTRGENAGQGQQSADHDVDKDSSSSVSSCLAASGPSAMTEEEADAALIRPEIPVRYEDEEREFFFSDTSTEVEEDAEIVSLGSQLLSDDSFSSKKACCVPFSTFPFIRSPLFPALKAPRGQRSRRDRVSCRLHKDGPIPCCCGDEEDGEEREWPGEVRGGSQYTKSFPRRRRTRKSKDSSTCVFVKNLPPPLPLSLHRFVPPQCLVSDSGESFQASPRDEEKDEREKRRGSGCTWSSSSSTEAGSSSSPAPPCSSSHGRRKRSSSLPYRNCVNVSFRTRDLLRRSYTVYDFFVTAFSEGLPAFFRNDCPLSCIPSCTFHDWCYRRPRPSLTPGKSPVFFPNPPSHSGGSDFHPGRGGGGGREDDMNHAGNPYMLSGGDGGGSGGYAMPGEAPPAVLFCNFLDAFSGVATAAICRGLHPATCSRASNVYHIVKVLELFLFSRCGSLERLPAHIVTAIPKRWKAALSFAPLPPEDKRRDERQSAGGEEEGKGKGDGKKTGAEDARGKAGGEECKAEEDSPRAGLLNREEDRGNGSLEEEDGEGAEKDAIMEEPQMGGEARKEEEQRDSQQAGMWGEVRVSRHQGDVADQDGRSHLGRTDQPDRLTTESVEEWGSDRVREGDKSKETDGEGEQEEGDGPPLLSLGLVMAHLLLSVQHPASQELLLRLLGKFSFFLFLFLCFPLLSSHCPPRHCDCVSS